MRFSTGGESQSSIDHEDVSAVLENSSILFTDEDSNDNPELENNDEVIKMRDENAPDIHRTFRQIFLIPQLFHLTALIWPVLWLKTISRQP